MSELLLHGEWWIDETGKPISADGDNGDLNHQGHVHAKCWQSLVWYMQTARNLEARRWLETDTRLNGDALALCELCDALLSLNDLYVQDGPDDCMTSEEFANAVDRLHKMNGKRGIKIPASLLDPSKSPFDWFAKHLQRRVGSGAFDRDVYDAAMGCEGNKDLRALGTIRWKWIRVCAQSVDLPDLKNDTLDRFIDGIEKAYPKIALPTWAQTTWCINVWPAKVWTDSMVPYAFLADIPYAMFLNGKELRRVAASRTAMAGIDRS